MSLDLSYPSQDGYAHSVYGHHYATSAPSYASSTTSLVSEGLSSQASGSSRTSTLASSQDSTEDLLSGLQCNDTQVQLEAQPRRCLLSGIVLPPLKEANLSVPPEQRQHPRRSSKACAAKAPPTLVRQCERKLNFVDNLVDSATQMVEVIWPLSVVPHKGESGNCKGVLPLRTYIEETLRRSRTSYSTLQVALYYLILIKDHVPKCDFTMEQQVDSPSARAMQCGRRMFLAALILASKYLQDRNYSAKAWSKMSGLKVSEINMNERAFLLAVNWKLHIPDCLFKRWTDIVLRFTPNPNPPSPGQGLPVLDNKSTWKVIVPLLTPELDTVTVPTQFERHWLSGPVGDVSEGRNADAVEE
ncbi:PHO85 cyclin-5 [Zalaria obscura]|uniref:PHO85 cyclin-5 n=1 Tax=Zalaria obscura TaxID=2024903 RepID=A0ACC3SFQ9_9PEZI